MKRALVLPALLLVTLASGCMYEMRDSMTDCKINLYNHMMAKSSYSQMDTACMGLSCPHSFKEGYFQGFKDVANGGTGCVPAVPQVRCCNHMWMDFCTESQKLEAWYDGYEFGAMAAKAEGFGDSNRLTTRIPTAPPIEYAMPSSGGAEPPTKDPSLQGGPEAAIPPAPLSNPAEGELQQSRRLPSSIFE